MTCAPRTVTLTDQPTMLRGVTVTSQMPAWPEKDPNEVLDYRADFQAILRSGDAIVTADAAPVSGGVTIIAQPAFVGSVVNLSIAGGTDGQTAAVAIKVTTSVGDTIIRSVGLPIVAVDGSGLFASNITYGGGAGGAQAGQLLTFRASTTGPTPGAVNGLATLPAALSACRLTGQVVAQDAVSGDCAIWDVATVVKRSSSSAAPSWVGAPCILPFAADTSMAGCLLAWTLGTDSPGFVLTGLSGRTLSWTANLINTVTGVTS